MTEPGVWAGAFAAKWRAPQLSQLVDRLGVPGQPLRGSGSLVGFSHLAAPQEADEPQAPSEQVVQLADVTHSSTGLQSMTALCF